MNMFNRLSSRIASNAARVTARPSNASTLHRSVSTRATAASHHAPTASSSSASNLLNRRLVNVSAALVGILCLTTSTYYITTSSNSDSSSVWQWLNNHNTVYAEERKDDREKKTTDQSELEGKQGLDPKNFKSFKIKDIKPYNHNTKVFLLELDDPDAPLNLPCASFILTKAQLGEKDDKGNDKLTMRPYTPINQHEKGVLNLMIKNYPEKGTMSKHVHSLKVGDTIDIKGPLPKIKYLPGAYANIGMIAGGTGITPMLQIIEEITSNPDDDTRVVLLFANLSKKDILLKERFDQLQEKNPNFDVVHVLENDDDWGNDPQLHEKGRVSKELIQKYLPPPEGGNQILVCGPNGMMEVITGPKAKDLSQGELSGMLKELNYEKDNVYKF